MNHINQINQIANQTAPRAMPNFLGPEFNRFLFAAIGTDRNGEPLSVVSALARLDLDPWAEAAALARLPRAAAVQKLSAMLRRYPEIPRLVQESGTVAAGLIALLPAGSNTIRQVAAAPSRWPLARGSAGIALLVAFGFVLALEIVIQATPSHAGPAAASAPTSLAARLR